MLDRLRKTAWVGLAGAVVWVGMATEGARGQLPKAADAAMWECVDAIVAKMTLDEKIDYIGGTGFAICAVPRLGLPV